MDIEKLGELDDIIPLVISDNTRSVTGVYCCDLLSLVMGRAPADSAWITVMGNVNSLAVASLADVACIVFAEGVLPEEPVKEKAKEKGINLFCTKLDVFSAAKTIDMAI